MPTTKVIEVSAPKEGKETQVSYDMPENLQEAVAMYGEAPVFDGFISDYTIYIQGVARKALKDGKPQSEIQSIVSGLKAGVKRSGTVDINAAVKAKMASMSPEERQAYINELLAG